MTVTYCLTIRTLNRQKTGEDPANPKLRRARGIYRRQPHKTPLARGNGLNDSFTTATENLMYRTSADEVTCTAKRYQGKESHSITSENNNNHDSINIEIAAKGNQLTIVEKRKLYVGRKLSNDVINGSNSNRPYIYARVSQEDPHVKRSDSRNGTDRRKSLVRSKSTVINLMSKWKSARWVNGQMEKEKKASQVRRSMYYA